MSEENTGRPTEYSCRLVNTKREGDQLVLDYVVSAAGESGSYEFTTRSLPMLPGYAEKIYTFLGRLRKEELVETGMVNVMIPESELHELCPSISSANPPLPNRTPSLISFRVINEYNVACREFTPLQVTLTWLYQIDYLMALVYDKRMEANVRDALVQYGIELQLIAYRILQEECPDQRSPVNCVAFFSGLFGESPLTDDTPIHIFQKLKHQYLLDHTGNVFVDPDPRLTQMLPFALEWLLPDTRRYHVEVVCDVEKQKRIVENEARQMRGEPPLPEEEKKVLDPAPLNDPPPTQEQDKSLNVDQDIRHMYPTQLEAEPVEPLPSAETCIEESLVDYTPEHPSFLYYDLVNECLSFVSTGEEGDRERAQEILKRIHTEETPMPLKMDPETCAQLQEAADLYLISGKIWHTLRRKSDNNDELKSLVDELQLKLEETVRKRDETEQKLRDKNSDLVKRISEKNDQIFALQTKAANIKALYTNPIDVEMEEEEMDTGDGKQILRILSRVLKIELIQDNEFRWNSVVYNLKMYGRFCTLLKNGKGMVSVGATAPNYYRRHPKKVAYMLCKWLLTTGCGTPELFCLEEKFSVNHLQFYDIRKPKKEDALNPQA